MEKLELETSLLIAFPNTNANTYYCPLSKDILQSKIFVPNQE